ncbi:MAG: hypothetical protein AYK18_05935 [Theionarchaea archaeon DG-70]|nr:MAG: hypothetical protein AYK18_05935 [Theionarchaea archaeon DG-70]
MRSDLIDKDSLQFELPFEYLLEDKKKHCDLVLAQISLDNFPSGNGYVDVDIGSKLKETFFLDIVNTILESKTSESHELQSYIGSQYEKIHQEYSDSTPETTGTAEPSKREIQNSERKEDEKFPWED